MTKIIDISDCKKIYVNDIATRDQPFIRMLSKYCEPIQIDNSSFYSIINKIANNWQYYEDMVGVFRNVKGATYFKDQIKARLLRNGTYDSRAIMLHGDKEKISDLIKKLNGSIQIIDLTELSRLN